ncbi:trigger factor [Candidatus Saccharibacteria bacterium]|nr:trigger factor [Candidatus Saccharibacteria bacterium]NCU40609.1 trigger factor [Candidatus Saccharibacteria bacterium]
MKHTLKKISDTQIELVVTLSSEDLATAKATTLKFLSRDIKVAGFRKGKVPANVAEKHLEPNILSNEVVEHAINDSMNEIVTIEDLRVLDQPKIELKKFVPYTEAEYSAVVEVLPDIKLGDYRKLKVKKTIKKVDQKDIDEVIERLRANSAEKQDSKVAAKLKDEVTIDFVGKKDGEPFDGGTATDYPITLGSNTFIPGFEDAIVGHKVGDKFDVPLKFPKDYHAKHLAGQPIVFEVTIKAIQTVSLPDFDDAFAAKVGPFKTKQELLDDVRRELVNQNERQSIDTYKDDLIGALVKLSNVPVPQLLVDDQMRSVEQDFKQNLMYRGTTPEQYIEQMGYKDEDEWRNKEFKDTAIRRVQSGLVLSELSKIEKIQVSKDELEMRLSEMQQQFPNMKDQLETPESRRDIANRVLTEKTLDRLVELNS